MKCRDVERRSTAYIDGELADAHASALRGHLRGCDACRALVEDEARLAEAAEDLAPLDPPPALWDAIHARIAAEEIADGQRGRLWLWWQGLRQHALPAAVGAVAVALFAVWWTQRDAQAPVAEAPVALPDTVEMAAADPAPAPAASFDEVRRAELERADRRFVAVIADLRAIVEDERDELPAAEVAELDRSLAELAREAGEERAALAASGSLEPADRSALYAVYQREIQVLRGVAMAGVSR